ncbi:MAG: S9 family peptidase, partial [Terracidiphilus sp.]
MQRRFGLVVVLWLGVEAGAVAQAVHGRGGITLPAPPPAEATPVLDNYFDTRIPDSYRWLEDAKSEETRAFIDAENAYTTHYMEQARIRPQVIDGLESLEQVSSWSLPIQRAGNYYFEKRLGGEGQASIYIRRGWTAKDERLIDPAVLSRDSNTSVELLDVSRDGTLIAYGVRQGGADESTVRVFNVKTCKIMQDELPSGLYWSMNFTPDGSGLIYSRDNAQGTLIYEHVFGTRTVRDTLLFGREFYDEPLGPNDLSTATVTEDGRYLVVTTEHGVPAKRVDIVFRDLTKPGSTFQVLVWGLDSRFSAIYAKGAWYVKTDYKAPMGR